MNIRFTGSFGGFLSPWTTKFGGRCLGIPRSNMNTGPASCIGRRVRIPATCTSNSMSGSPRGQVSRTSPAARTPSRFGHCRTRTGKRCREFFARHIASGRHCRNGAGRPRCALREPLCRGHGRERLRVAASVRSHKYVDASPGACPRGTFETPGACPGGTRGSARI